MKHLYDPTVVAEVKGRIAGLRPDSVRRWGKMDVAQAVAHMAIGMEAAVGDCAPPRVLIGRLLGRFAKGPALGNDAPLMKNAPTAPAYVVADARELERERGRLVALVDRFAAGPSACTRHPHAFFGALTPDEWAILCYKHLDHHLRQFGA